MAGLTLTSEGSARRIEFANVLDRVLNTSRRQLCWVDRRFSFLFHSGPPSVKVVVRGARVSARKRRLLSPTDLISNAKPASSSSLRNSVARSNWDTASAAGASVTASPTGCER